MNAKKISVLILIICASLLLCCACLKKAEKADDTTVEGTTVEETTEVPKETVPETEAVEELKTPEFFNPLTGLGTETDISKKRPVAIMVNNLREALPQVGISQADVMYECLAEGGITRLMMLSADYEKLTKVGSVRSARDYYLDYAAGYDGIFVHAGGSVDAYDNYTFAKKDVNRIDGVRGPGYLFGGTGTFERDPDRVNKYAREHTLVVKSGAGIANAVSYFGYRTEKAEGYENSMNFVGFGKAVSFAQKATHIKVVISSYQIVDYVYSKDTREYLRYQYNGNPHMDSAVDKQLSFKNVMVIFTRTTQLADAYNHIAIETTGTGEGWYITEGSYSKITWKKDSTGSVLKFFFEDGSEVKLNRGKTMINVVPTTNASLVTFDNEWKDK